MARPITLGHGLDDEQALSHPHPLASRRTPGITGPRAPYRDPPGHHAFRCDLGAAFLADAGFDASDGPPPGPEPTPAELDRQLAESARFFEFDLPSTTRYVPDVDIEGTALEERHRARVNA